MFLGSQSMPLIGSQLAHAPECKADEALSGLASVLQTVRSGSKPGIGNGLCS